MDIQVVGTSVDTVQIRFWDYIYEMKVGDGFYIHGKRLGHSTSEDVKKIDTVKYPPSVPMVLDPTWRRV